MTTATLSVYSERPCVLLPAFSSITRLPETAPARMKKPWYTVIM